MNKYLLSIFAFIGFATAAPVTLPQDISFTDGATSWTWDNVAVSGGGLTVEDGEFKGLSDAYDSHAYLSVDGVMYSPSVNADLSDISVNSTVIGKLLTTDTVVMSGLNVTRKILFFNTAKEQSAVARDITILQNPTNAPISIAVAWGGNLGSDGSTAVRGNSNGTSSFDVKDIWVITSDDSTNPSDPVLGHVAQGKSCVVNRPAGSVLLEDNAFHLFNLTIPAGDTLSVVNILQMSDTNANGISAASVIFGSLDGPTNAGIFADLTDEEKDQIVNFGFSDCKADYRALVTDALKKVKKQIALGKSGKAAVTATNLADAEAQKYGDEITLRTGKTEAVFLKASKASVSAVKAAAKAGKTNSSDFEALKTKAQRSLNTLLKKIVAE